MSSLGQWLEQAARRRPRGVLLSDGSRGLASGRVVAQADAIAAQLARGAGPLSLASRLDNGIDALLLDFAVRVAGGVHVPLPPYFSPPQVAHALADSGASWLVLPSQMPAPGPDWVEASLPFLGQSRGWRRAVAAPARWPAGTACITYTSGTTGQAKGVCLDEPTLLAVARSLSAAMAPLSPRRHLCALPLATLLENVGAYAALASAAEIRLPGLAELGYSGASGLQPQRLLACIERYRPHSMILVPQLLDGLLQAVEDGGRPAPGLRCVAVGGAHVPQSLRARAALAGIPLFEGYGLSECGSVVCLNRPGASRPGSVGKPLPHVRLRVDAEGEVHVAGTSFLGYLDGPAAGDEVATGDIGRLDADGFLHLLGRRRHVFITSYGRNVAPDWIEAELCASPLIAQAVVDGEARPRNIAVVVPRDPRSSDADLRQAVDAVNARLPDYARIAEVLRSPEPFTPTNGLATANGRVRRDRVLAHFADGIARRFGRRVGAPNSPTLEATA